MPQSTGAAEVEDPNGFPSLTLNTGGLYRYLRRHGKESTDKSIARTMGVSLNTARRAMHEGAAPNARMIACLLSLPGATLDDFFTITPAGGHALAG